MPHHPLRLPNPPPLHGPTPPLAVRFRVSHRVTLRYLQTLRVIAPDTKPHAVPPPLALDRLLSTVHFFKSKGFPNAAFPRLASACPQLFHPALDPAAALSPVFDFLSHDVRATDEQSRALIALCPRILLSDVDHSLRPTLRYLEQLGIGGLSSPTNLHAHLLNTRVEKMKETVRFLRSVGFGYEEATEACARLPAMFGYGIESNLRPKYEYLVRDMGRGVEEVKVFPQYFAFSLRKRIRPRDVHLRRRNVRLPLKRMLMWNDAKFYAKWK